MTSNPYFEPYYLAVLHIHQSDQLRVKDTYI